MTTTKFVLFVKPECPDCTAIKSDVPSNVDVVDATTIEGMALASFHEVLKMKMPVLLDLETQTHTSSMERICSVLHITVNGPVEPECKGGECVI